MVNLVSDDTIGRVVYHRFHSTDAASQGNRKVLDKPRRIMPRAYNCAAPSDVLNEARSRGEQRQARLLHIISQKKIILSLVSHNPVRF